MQRRVRQHHPDQVVAGCDEIGERRAGPFAQKDDRARAAGEQGGFVVVDVRDGVSRSEVTCHDRKRFVDATFAVTESGQSSVV